MNAIVIPDYQGLASVDNFALRIKEALSFEQDYKIIMVINGANPTQLKDALNANNLIGKHCVSIISPAGFNSAVMAGLTKAVELGANKIIRMDTAEHPLEEIESTILFLTDYDVVVRDLEFNTETLIKDSVDEYHNLEVIPLVLSTFTKERLPLSGAHGFMGIRGEVLRTILPDMVSILAKASEGGASVSWASDTLIPIIASRRGYKVQIERIPAVLVRNRPSSKCAQQLRDTLTLTRAMLALNL